VQLGRALLGAAAAALGVGRDARHVAADDLDQLEAERPDDPEQPLRHVLVGDVTVATRVALDQLAGEGSGQLGQIGDFGRHGAVPLWCGSWWRLRCIDRRRMPPLVTAMTKAYPQVVTVMTACDGRAAAGSGEQGLAPPAAGPHARRAGEEGAADVADVLVEDVAARQVALDRDELGVRVALAARKNRPASRRPSPSEPSTKL
jgi:hypothetical protein